MRPFSWPWAVPSLADLGQKLDLIARSIPRCQGEPTFGAGLPRDDYEDSMICPRGLLG